ncbi:hypothetical protein CLPUN_06860 [Clostridium puniceum]|uniref:Uncharacterized protein n=1 Tax=Clostridium puniceum TaxID=29367 RepID=A0A1S8TW60_9CLOT|nr:hypothetical protein CLPUN_06860 [Clostridium puniceum]
MLMQNGNKILMDGGTQKEAHGHQVEQKLVETGIISIPMDTWLKINTQETII